MVEIPIDIRKIITKKQVVILRDDLQAHTRYLTTTHGKQLTDEEKERIGSYFSGERFPLNIEFINC